MDLYLEPENGSRNLSSGVNIPSAYPFCFTALKHTIVMSMDPTSDVVSTGISVDLSEISQLLHIRELSESCIGNSWYLL